MEGGEWRCSDQLEMTTFLGMERVGWWCSGQPEMTPLIGKEAGC